MGEPKRPTGWLGDRGNAGMGQEVQNMEVLPRTPQALAQREARGEELTPEVAAAVAAERGAGSPGAAGLPGVAGMPGVAGFSGVAVSPERSAGSSGVAGMPERSAGSSGLAGMPERSAGSCGAAGWPERGAGLCGVAGMPGVAELPEGSAGLAERGAGRGLPCGSVQPGVRGREGPMGLLAGVAADAAGSHKVPQPVTPLQLLVGNLGEVSKALEVPLPGGGQN